MGQTHRRRKNGIWRRYAYSKNAEKFDDLGYVFDLKVLRDNEPGSNIYAIAGARYSVVDIVI